MRKYPNPVKRIKEIREYELGLRNLRETDAKKSVDYFFRKENLSVGGVYYFFLFSSSAPENAPRQLFVTLAESFGRNIKLENTSMKKSAGLTGYCWFFDEKKYVFPVKSGVTEFGNRNLSFSSDNFSFKMSGDFPEFNLTGLGSSNKSFNLNTFSKGKSQEFEWVNYFKGPLGYLNINYRLRFDGVLNGKPFSGSGYLQKIIVLVPVFPWNWMRINFSDDSVLNIFTPYLIKKGRVKVPVDSSGYFFDAKTDKTVHFKKCSFTLLNKSFNRWMVDCSNDKEKLSVILSSYSSKNLEIKGLGKITYTSNLVKVTDLMYQSVSGPRDLSDFGNFGAGMLENVTGFVI